MKKGDIKQQQILDFIEEFSSENGFPPTVREIAEKFDIKSTSTVAYYLDKLKESGQIVYEAQKKRAIVVPKPKTACVSVPLVGNVSCGTGLLAVENIEGRFALPPEVFPEEGLFLLRVQGNSMIKIGIADGDLVVVKKQESVELDEIAVVLWDDVCSVKRITSMSPNLVMHPENDQMEDIVLPPDTFPQILGKVIGCIKRF